MLSELNFNVLSYLIAHPEQMPTQRVLAEALGCSLGKLNAAVSELRQAKLIDDDKTVITPCGLQAMEPFRVKNAIIMAAGMSSRFAPLSYEKPKALLSVKGELLIEREIEQLQAAGITDITVVLGYLKEQLFYLEKKYGVRIVINEDYYRYNNTSTLIRVLDRLDNTYICSSDNYFSENPFEAYVYRSYYSSVYAPGRTDEYCMVTNKKGRITDVTVGGRAAWYMIGHAYFDRSFSRIFSTILQEQYDSLQTRLGLWEDLYIRNIDKLALYIRHYESDVIKEFDSLDELRSFDPKYLSNTGSQIFGNICKVLGVDESAIEDIVPIKNGLTNLSFRFTVDGRKYVYRHPGVGTANYINREGEAKSLAVAKELGLDDTFIFMDQKEGWKVSSFVENAVTLDYHNKEQVDKALSMLNRLHACGANTGHTFDIWQECLKFEERLSQRRAIHQFEDMQELHDRVEKALQLSESAGFETCLCHCDSYDPNFLVDAEGNMFLIDWEYSGMSQRGVDLGTFIACSDYTLEEAYKVLQSYLGHCPSKTEEGYFISYIAAAAYYWFVWAIYQESVGKPVGEYLYIWYKYAQTYSERALKIYQEEKQ